MYSYQAKIINIVDGDTVDAEIDLGFKIKVTHRLRLVGIDTEEMNDPDPQLRELAKAAKDYLTQTLLDQTVNINTYKADLFGRYLAEIYVNESSVNTYLLEAGLAKKWKR